MSFCAGLAVKSGILYLYGGLWEEGEKDYTLKGKLEQVQ